MKITAEDLGKILQDKEFNDYMSNLKEKDYFTVVYNIDQLEVSRNGENGLVVMIINHNRKFAFKNLKHFKNQEYNENSYLINPMACIENKGYLHLIQQVKHQKELTELEYHNLAFHAGTDEFDNHNSKCVYQHLKLKRDMPLKDLIEKLRVFEYTPKIK